MSDRYKFILSAAIIVLLALSLRLVNLLRFPIFADEAIYASWSLAMRTSIENINLPILDGKPPLYMLLYSRLFDIFNFSPVLLARLISVFSGTLVVILTFFLAKIMQLNRKGQLTALFLAAISFYLVYLSRLGLLDSLLTSFTTLTFVTFLAAILVSQGRSAYLLALISGLSFGLALWTKTSAFFLVIPLIFLGAYYAHSRRQVQTLAQTLLVVAIAAVIFLLLAKLSVFPSLFSRSQDFAFTFTEIINGEYLFTLKNIFKFAIWLSSYTGWLSISLVVLAWVKSETGPVRPVAVATLLLVLPLLILGKVLSPRYLLPALPLWLVFFAAGLSSLKSRPLTALILCLTVIQMLFYDLKLVTNPDQTPFVARDQSEYLTSWSSGHGVYETAAYLRQVADQFGRVSVATEGFYGPVPTGLQLVLYDDKRIDVYGIGQPIDSLPGRTRKEAKTMPTFLVVNKDRLINKIPNTTLIAEYPRPSGGESLLLFRVMPQR